MNNVRKLIMVVGASALLMTLSVVAASAQTGTVPTVVNNSPAMAYYIDNSMHTAPVGVSVWYKFDYNAALHAKDRSPIYLTLVNGNNSGVEFQVYTPSSAIDMIPDNLEDWRQNTPIGQGTAQHETCETHIPKPSGDCISPDLTWVGTFAESGTYYVRVKNDTQFPAGFTLTVRGADVGIGQQAHP